jgi:hypothetical protein
VGEIDIGQYDAAGVHSVLGLCFAAALLRRAVFEQLGGLREDFFMYAEDSEWCLRAKAHGYSFILDPRAVVVHAHSMSTGVEGAVWKNWLIRRNTVLTVIQYAPLTTLMRSLFWVLRAEAAEAFARRDGTLLTSHVAEMPRRMHAALGERRRAGRQLRKLRRDQLLAGDADCGDHHVVASTGMVQPAPKRTTLLAMYGRRRQPADADMIRVLRSPRRLLASELVTPILDRDGQSVRDLFDETARAEAAGVRHRIFALARLGRWLATEGRGYR